MFLSIIDDKNHFINIIQLSELNDNVFKYIFIQISLFLLIINRFLIVSF